MTFITSSRRASPRRTSFWAGISHFLGIRRQRRALRALDETALRDIGVTRAEAEAEARRPVWDAPETWHN